MVVLKVKSTVDKVVSPVIPVWPVAVLEVESLERPVNPVWPVAVLEVESLERPVNPVRPVAVLRVDEPVNPVLPVFVSVVVISRLVERLVAADDKSLDTD